jgi:CHAT domain-containing protein
LQDVDLVVLSACQTALGETNSDGVFGLQRGFKKAGARTLVMSLWKVDDEATQILMSDFYKQIASGKKLHEAFVSAQKHLRESQNGKFSDPYYWAAFVMLDAV